MRNLRRIPFSRLASGAEVALHLHEVVGERGAGPTIGVSAAVHGDEAVGTQILARVSWEQGTLTHEPQVLGQAAHLWSRSSLRPEDVDLALVYDGFTFNAISWIEALGFCELGGARDWLDGGRRIALGGELPVNPHGGQL